MLDTRTGGILRAILGSVFGEFSVEGAFRSEICLQPWFGRGFRSFCLLTFAIFYVHGRCIGRHSVCMGRAYNKQRISLTVDPDIWVRCRQKSKEYGLNWSEIAEQAFAAVLVQLEQMERIVQSAPSGTGRALVKSQLRAYLGEALADSYQELEELEEFED